MAQQFLARFTGTEGVLFVGRAQEKARVWRTQRRYNQAGEPTPGWCAPTAFINFFYFYCVDDDFGPFFIKFSTYFPYTAKLCINGNEWAKRQAAKAGIGFEALDNGFAAVDDVAAVQAICDSLGPEQIDALLRKWLRDPAQPVHRRRRGRRLPLRAVDPAGGVLADPDAGPPGVRADLLRAGAARQPRHRPPRPGRPDLRPPHHPPGPSSDPGPVPHPGDHRRRHPILHVDYKNTKIKQYHKQGRALRTETTINNPHDFGVSKRLTNLPALRQIGFTANRRLLGVQRISHDPIRGAQAFTDLTAPIVTDDGTRIPGLRFGDTRVHALLQALLVHRLLPHGFTNRDLRTLIAPLLGTTIRGHHRRADDLRPAPPARPRAHRTHPPHPPLPRHRHRAAARAAVHPRPRPPAPRRTRPDQRPEPTPADRAAQAPPAPTKPPSTTSPITPDSPPEPNTTPTHAT